MITKVKTANHEEWKALRSQYIGGSDAAAVVGLNTYSSPYALWAEKTGRVPGFEGNLATEVGSYLEDFVARKFSEQTGKRVRRVNQSFFNSDYPWAIANIDRDIVGEDAGLEIKTTSELCLSKFKNGEYPANYYCQAVHYMAITGKKRWYLAVLIGNKDFRIFTIERDQAEIDALMAAEQQFWEHVKTDTPPAVDGHAATSKALGTLYPDSEDGAVVDLCSHIADLDSFVALNQQIKELEEQRNMAANKVKEFMANAGNGENDCYRVTWKTSSRRTFDYKQFMADNPDMDFSPYFKESQNRIFRVSEQKGA